jgi:serine/threonine protein kinase
MSFDFTPYGYTYHLQKGNPLLKHISLLIPVISVSKKQIVTKKHTYELGVRLGKGTFGTTYKAVINGTNVAIKEIRYQNRQELWESVKEVILQILLYDATKDLADGPYVPNVIELAYNPKKDILYIIQELMDGTFESLIKHRTVDENDKFLRTDIDTIAKQLDWLATHLKFNHRDLKSDNVMYKQHSDGIHLRLIDFGMSCMTWKGIHLSASSDLFPISHPCYRPSRDMSSLLFEIARYERKYISKEMFEFLHQLVIFQYKDKSINMLKTMNWQNTYEFLNRKNVENPKAVPSSLRKTIKSKHTHPTTTRKRCRH